MFFIYEYFIDILYEKYEFLFFFKYYCYYENYNFVLICDDIYFFLIFN